MNNTQSPIQNSADADRALELATRIGESVEETLGRAHAYLQFLSGDTTSRRPEGSTAALTDNA